jgi:hypothetical protein
MPWFPCRLPKIAGPRFSQVTEIAAEQADRRAAAMPPFFLPAGRCGAATGRPSPDKHSPLRRVWSCRPTTRMGLGKDLRQETKKVGIAGTIDVDGLVAPDNPQRVDAIKVAEAVVPLPTSQIAGPTIPQVTEGAAAQAARNRVDFRSVLPPNRRTEGRQRCRLSLIPVARRGAATERPFSDTNRPPARSLTSTDHAHGSGKDLGQRPNKMRRGGQFVLTEKSVRAILKRWKRVDLRLYWMWEYSQCTFSSPLHKRL